jgi:hypothetical protein
MAPKTPSEALRERLSKAKPNHGGDRGCKSNHRLQATAKSLVSLRSDVGASPPAPPISGRERPVAPRSAETGAARGSSRPVRPAPEPWAGATEPASCQGGPVQEGGCRPQSLLVLLLPQPHGPWPDAPREHAGRSPLMPQGSPPSSHDSRRAPPRAWGAKRPGATSAWLGHPLRPGAVRAALVGRPLHHARLLRRLSGVVLSTRP